jgi:hypothetical protein
MRDGDERYDAQTAMIGYQLALNLFSRTLWVFKQGILRHMNCTGWTVKI